MRVIVNYQLTHQSTSHILIWETNDSTFVRQIDNKKASDINEVIVGLKPDTNYSFRIETNCGNKSEILSFQTEQFPYEEMNKLSLIKDSGAFKGYLLFHTAIKSGGQILSIINDDGQVVWYEYLPKPSSTFSWTSDNTIVALLEMDQMIEIDLKGNILFQSSYGSDGFQEKMHHEIRKNEAGEYYGITYHGLILDENQRAKYNTDSLTTDGIVVLNSENQIVWKWNLFDVELPNPDTLSIKTKMIDDWAHANAVWQDSNRDFYISFRNFSQIWKIDFETGNVLWKLGQNGTINIDEASIFHQQHAVVQLANGHLLLYDNGDRYTQITRALIFDINSSNLTSELVRDYKLPVRLHSFKRGNAVPANDELMLLNSSMTDVAAILDVYDSIQFEVRLPNSSYRVEYLPTLDF